MRIGSFDTDRKVLVVAEIGNNHEGNFQRAAELVRAAAACGVDGVKFQTVRADQLVRRSDTERFERLKRFELTEGQFGELSNLARGLGLAFLSTPLALSVVSFLEPMVDAFKIASGDNDFFPLLEQVARTGKPLVISTGVSELSQIDAAVSLVRGQWALHGGTGELALLHCVSSYPAPLEQSNLRSIPFLAEQFGCTVGYSDHTLGIQSAVLAAATGARIIEKHFTLDKNFSDFRDHQLSADPAEMREIVKQVRQVESLLGVWDKRIEPCEAPSRTAIRRSIAAARDLKKGTRITAGDLKWLRPADGLRPDDEVKLLDRVLKRDVQEDEAIRSSDVG